MPRSSIPITDRLAAHRRITEAGCWEWTGWKDAYGYGLMPFYRSGSYRLTGRARRDVRKVHRVAATVFHVDGGGPNVLHRCDNPACFNPEHLFRGTQSDNLQDMASKHRGRKSESHYGRTGQPTRHSKAKLSEMEAEHIRRAYARGDVLQRELAARYGIHQTQVSGIVRGLFYKPLLNEALRAKARG